MSKIFLFKTDADVEKRMNESLVIFKIAMFTSLLPTMVVFLLYGNIVTLTLHQFIIVFFTILIFSFFFALINGGIFFYNLKYKKPYSEVKKISSKVLKESLMNTDNLSVVTLYLEGVNTPVDILYDMTSGKLLEEVKIEGDISWNKFVTVVTNYKITVV